jgi:hypothetical protein
MFAIRGLVPIILVFIGGVALAQPPTGSRPATPPAPPGLRPAALQPADAPPLLPPPPPSAPIVEVPSVPPPVVPVEPQSCLPADCRSGFFGTVDLDLVFPHVTNGLSAPVFIRPIGFGDVVVLPSVPLDSTIAPEFKIGYRLRDNLGAILVSYRNLSSEGRDLFTNFDIAGDGFVRSRLDMNTVGLAYSTCENPIGALWSMRWELGAKLSSIYFDSDGQGMVIGQHVSDHFLGAGPSIALDMTRELPPSGLAVYGRAEFAELLGQVTQRYSETVGDPTQPDGFGYFEQHMSQGVPVLGLQLGLSWLSRPTGRYRLTAGYSFEHYWAVGKVGDTHGDVMAQGLFLRTEFNY